MKIVVLAENTCEAGEGAEPKCGCEHGLSLYVETERHRLLLDTGASDLFLKNAEAMGIDLREIDTVVLSHGHYDHAGGILAFAGINSRAPIYMQRGALGDFYHGERYIGMDKEIGELSQARFLDGEFTIDGELSVFAGITGRRCWPKSNRALTRRENGIDRQDDFSHEQCLVIRAPKGNYLLSGCAHNGILNILDRYGELYETPPKVVISGFHMMKKTEYTPEELESIQDTAHTLARMDTVFYTGHCTGRKAFSAMKDIMGDKLRPMHSGGRLM